MENNKIKRRTVIYKSMLRYTCEISVVSFVFLLLKKERRFNFFIPGLPFLSAMLMTPFLYKFVVRLLYLNINVLSTCVGAGGNVMKSKLGSLTSR